MTAKPVELSTRSFRTQSLATAHFRAMLHRYAVGGRVGEEDGLDLSALLERHDEYVEKVGCGVDFFEVMMTEHGTPCFRVVRTDGSGTDFSFGHCVTRRPPSRKQEVSQAFRHVVRIDLYNARDAFFAEHKDAEGRVPCAETGELIRRDEAHMDHRAPLTFEVLVTTFVEGRGLSLTDVPLTVGTDEQVSPEVTDPNLAEAFRGYHARLARLDLVKNTANLAQASRNRMKPSRIQIST